MTDQSGTRSPGSRRWVGWLGSRWLGIALALYVLLRVPSWFEPHWYTDEAGYANTAFLSTHGKILYLTVWNNKPPLLFWIYDLALSWFGPSELGLHLLSTLAGVLVLVALYLILRENWEGRGAAVTLPLAAVLLGLPLLGGDLALPENFFIAPEAFAMLLVLRAVRTEPGRGRLVAEIGAGVLFGLGCLIQQTVLGPFVAAAVFVWLVSGGRRLRGALVMAGAGILVVAAGIAPYLFWAGPSHVFFFLVKSFQGYTARTLPLSPTDLLPRALAGLLLVGGLAAARRLDRRTVLVWLWLGVDLLVYVLPNRPYPDHLLPAAVPFALAVGTLEPAVLRVWRWRPGLMPLVGGVALSGALWVGLMGANLGAGDFYTVGRSALYYQMFVGRMTGVVDLQTYRAFYDSRVSTEAQAANWIRQHGLQRATAVAWSADSWVYLLAPVREVLPAPPIYKDFDWLGQARLLRDTLQRRPELILLTDGSLTNYGPVQSLLARYYVKVQQDSRGSLWLLRSDATQVVGAKGTVAVGAG